MMTPEWYCSFAQPAHQAGMPLRMTIKNLQWYERIPVFLLNKVEDYSQGQKSLPCWADILGKHFILSLFPLQLKITNIAILI